MEHWLAKESLGMERMAAAVNRAANRSFFSFAMILVSHGFSSV
jgi:hypothetical protein